MATTTNGIATEAEAAVIGGVSGITSTKAAIKSKLADIGCKVKSAKESSYIDTQAVKYEDLEKNEVTYNCNLYYQYSQASASVISEHREGSTVSMSINKTYFLQSSAPKYLRGTFDGDYSTLGNFTFSTELNYLYFSIRGKINGTYTSATDHIALNPLTASIDMHSSSTTVTSQATYLYQFSPYIESMSMQYSGFSPTGHTLYFPYPSSGTSYGIPSLSRTIDTGRKDSHNRNVKIKFVINWVTS